jgi:cobalt-precorrin-5B (C1)-methyltransferase
MLKYLARHPVPRVTIAGGFGKIAKLAQGAMDLHSGRSQVDFDALAAWAGVPAVAGANTAAQALEIAGPALAAEVAGRAARVAKGALGSVPITVDVMVVGRDGRVLAVRDAV